eukprot:g8791.t1
MMRFLPCVAGALLTATAVEARAEKDSSHSLQAVLDPSETRSSCTRTEEFHFQFHPVRAEKQPEARDRNCFGGAAYLGAQHGREKEVEGWGTDQPGDSFTGASATGEEMCSDACMDALDTYETACEDCHCTTEAAGGDGTSCEDACKAYYQTCYEADEDALHDDVIEICNENY